MATPPCLQSNEALVLSPKLVAARRSTSKPLACTVGVTDHPGPDRDSFT